MYSVALKLVEVGVSSSYNMPNIEPSSFPLIHMNERNFLQETHINVMTTSVQENVGIASLSCYCALKPFKEFQCNQLPNGV